MVEKDYLNIEFAYRTLQNKCQQYLIKKTKSF